MLSQNIAQKMAIDILLVEDNPGDVRLTREVLKDARILNNLFLCNDGEQALDFLRLRGANDGAVRPDLVLLDLNLPRKGGSEVLSEIKSDPYLRCIPVVVLTTSGAEHDILSSYDLHANCYITKPVDLGQFKSVIGALQNFWLGLVKLPMK
jgi:CheY-like chemotaxis protein